MIGRKHASLIAKNPETSLAAIVAPDHPHNLQFASGLGVPWFQEVEEALEANAIDGAIISSPNAFHFQQALVCIERKIPVLIEKPLTDDIAKAAELASLSEATGAKVLVGHHRTYSPLLAAAKEFVQSDIFGRAVSLVGSAQFLKPDEYFSAGPWRTRVGGGPILINLIHEIGIMRFLFGEIASVTARISNAIRSFEVEDSAAITLSFKSGALGTFLLSDASASSKSWEMTAGENSAYPYFPDQNCYYLAGTMGSLDFPSMRYRSYKDQPQRSWWSPFIEGQLSFVPSDPLELQLNHFVDVIRGNTKPMVTARDGYLNMTVLEAIRDAAQQGRAVLVSEGL